MSIHFMSFATKKFSGSLARIEQEAIDSGFFDRVHCFKYTDLPLKYRLKYFARLHRFNRGFGHWMWKSYVTQLVLEDLNEGDILFYLDAGSTVNKGGRKRFNEYIEILKDSPYSNLSFQMPHKEKCYTKGDVFSFFGVENDTVLKNSGMLVGGVFFLIKNSFTSGLIHEWFSICHHKKYLIDDSVSSYPNDPDFIDCRHDQSIFSILRKLRGTTSLPDETFYTNWEANMHFPFHTRRLR